MALWFHDMAISIETAHGSEQSKAAFVGRGGQGCTMGRGLQVIVFLSPYFSPVSPEFVSF